MSKIQLTLTINEIDQDALTKLLDGSCLPYWLSKSEEQPKEIDGDNKIVADKLKESLDASIKKELGFQGKTNDRWDLQASVKYYLESGSVTGGLYEVIAKIVASQTLK